MPTPYATVLVPAYNEETVIHRALSPLARAVDLGQLQVLVVANGCHDDTVGAARRACPGAEVFELAKASKTRALNLAARHIRGRSVVLLDADLTLPETALRALVEPILFGQAEISLGRMCPELSQASRLVKMFYRGWSLSPYFDKGKAGGVIALSRRCTKDVFPLRAFTSDDEFISRLAEQRDRAYVPQAAFQVTVPSGMRDLLAIRRRSRRGTAAIEAAGFVTLRPTQVTAFMIVLGRALRQPARLPDVLVYAAIMLLVRLQLQFTLSAPPLWERDTSSRAAIGHKVSAKASGVGS